MDTHGDHLVYLYCVTAQPPALDRVSDRPGELYVVCETGLYAVARHVEAAEFEPSNLRRNIEDLTWLAAWTTEHERIAEAIMREQCVIPFRFPTVFDNDESLKTRLRTHAGPFKTLLQQLEDKSEWGVKIYCDTEKLKDAIETHSSAVSSLDEAIRSACPGKAFLLQKKRQDLAREALTKATNQYAQRTMEVLGPLSFQTRINKVLPARATEQRSDMILSSAFLVGNSHVEAFVEAMDALTTRYAPESVVVEHTGPWPPYNFCELATGATDE